ncbi:MAG: hypothetical protein QG657_2448 [Acidobacteriota bacterium]|nr:hypothetical protein [Acidobacteriota bacterium]
MDYSRILDHLLSIVLSFLSAKEYLLGIMQSLLSAT